MPKLRDVAKVVRSKNAGPFEICFDIMFYDAETFSLVKDAGVINSALFSRLYNVSENECLFSIYDNGWAMKCTIARAIPSGHFGDSDVYGSQQSIPLGDVEIQFTNSV